MKKISYLLLLFALATACSQEEKLPRIAVAGLAIESSTFSPAVTLKEAFHPLYGEEVLNFYPFLGNDSPNRTRAEWFPTLKAKAIPGGIVKREVYEELVNETLDRLRENLPYDAMYIELHGAMSVEGLDDPEADYVKRIREVIGNEALVSSCMDLHGNVTPELAKNIDLMTCYRMAPHEDAMESKQRAVETLLDRLESGKGKPQYKAWIPVPILLPGEKTSTRIEPGKSLYAKVAPTAARKGVLDASIWVGYAWADEPRNRAVVMVTGDDEEAVKSSAEELAEEFWAVRDQFEFVAPVDSLEGCLNAAIASKEKPFIISDTGDNPTAGGAGDVTWTLREILKRKEFQSAEGTSLIYASIPGPKLVEKALEVGIGGKVEEYVGAAVDNRYAPPIKLTGTVKAIREGDKHAGVEVVVTVGSVDVIVTKTRKPYHFEKDFTNLGLNPHDTDILVVKIGYLVPELYNMRKGWLMALTPGGVDQDLIRLGHKRVIRPIYPLDADMEKPNLKATLIPVCGK